MGEGVARQGGGAHHSKKSPKKMMTWWRCGMTLVHSSQSIRPKMKMVGPEAKRGKASRKKGKMPDRQRMK